MRNAVLFVVALCLAGAESVFAHGGSHPTPLPPPPTPSPSSPTPLRPPIPVPRRNPVLTGTGPGKNALTEDVVRFLIKQTEHEYFDVRGAAALALGRGGGRSKPAAVAPLETLTADGNMTVA